MSPTRAAAWRGALAQDAEIDTARSGVARLWGVDAGDIGFVGNVAEGVSIVAESLDWREGDTICIDANEYPSVVGPIVMRRNPAVGIRQARGNAPDRLAAGVDASTRIIAVSYVSYLTGERVDLSALRVLADRGGGAAAGRLHPGVRLFADRGRRSPISHSPPATNGCLASPALRWRIGTAGGSRTGHQPRLGGIHSPPGPADTTTCHRCAATPCASPAATRHTPRSTC